MSDDRYKQAVDAAWRMSDSEVELRALVRKAQARYDAMTPEQKAAQDKAQRESWVRGMAPTGDPRFD